MSTVGTESGDGFGHLRVIRRLASTAGHERVLARSGTDTRELFVERLVLGRLNATEREELEARVALMRPIVSPHLPRIIDVAHDKDFILVTSAAVTGEWLSELASTELKRGTQFLSLAVELRIQLDVFAALSALHLQGFVHGALGPNQMLVGVDGHTRLVGLLRQPSARVPAAYAAPEILLSDGTADHRADLYSAAVLLWEVLSGASLFGDADVSAILARQLAGPMPRPVVRAAWAEPLVDIVMRGLSVNPSDRPEAASDFASAIRLVSQARLAATTRVGRTVEALAEEALAMRRLGQPAAISSSGLHRSMSPSSGAIRAAAPPIAGHASRPGEGKSHPDDEVTSQRATPPRKSDPNLSATAATKVLKPVTPTAENRVFEGQTVEARTCLPDAGPPPEANAVVAATDSRSRDAAKVAGVSPAKPAAPRKPPPPVRRPTAPGIAPVDVSVEVETSESVPPGASLPVPRPAPEAPPTAVAAMSEVSAAAASPLASRELPPIQRDAVALAVASPPPAPLLLPAVAEEAASPAPRRRGVVAALLSVALLVLVISGLAFARRVGSASVVPPAMTAPVPQALQAVPPVDAPREGTEVARSLPDVAPPVDAPRVSVSPASKPSAAPPRTPEATPRSVAPAKSPPRKVTRPYEPEGI